MDSAVPSNACAVVWFEIRAQPEQGPQVGHADGILLPCTPTLQYDDSETRDIACSVRARGYSGDARGYMILKTSCTPALECAYIGHLFCYLRIVMKKRSREEVGRYLELRQKYGSIGELGRGLQVGASSSGVCGCGECLNTIGARVTDLVFGRAREGIF